MIHNTLKYSDIKKMAKGFDINTRDKKASNIRSA